MRPKFTAMNTNDSDKNSWLRRTIRPGHSLVALLPIMAIVFIAFLVIGIAMPVLPLHVHHGLELSTFVVGLVAGSQFAAAIASRVWAGRYADASGAKHAVIAGLVIAAAGGDRLPRWEYGNNGRLQIDTLGFELGPVPPRALNLSKAPIVMSVT